MRLSFAVLLASVAAASSASAEPTPSAAAMKPTSISARDTRIATMGRLAFAGDDARLGFPGVTIRFVYRGPAPALRFTASSPHCAFNLSCNGWDPVVIRLAEGPNEIALPTGAAPGSGWLVELVRRNESWQGVATFQGLTLPPDCELLAPPVWPERRLMFIGDSITCGEYLERFPPENDNTARMCNAGRAFGMLLGRWLDAQVHLVGYGGRGVLRDWQGNTDTNNAPQFFPLALPDDPAAEWDHAAYEPDAIVVCLGANDFSKDTPDEALYTRTYAAFVAAIRRAHPKAALILAESPIFGEAPGTPDRAKRDALRRTIEAVVAQRRAAGDLRVVVAPVRHHPGTPGNAHPVAFQHEQIALELMGPIRALTGW